MSENRLPIATKDNRSNLLRAFKATGCAVCGVRYPEVDWSELHIDHFNPADKSYWGVGTRGRNGSGIPNRATAERTISELLVCQVLCRTCHKDKHRRNDMPVAWEQPSLFNGNGSWHYEGVT